MSAPLRFAVALGLCCLASCPATPSSAVAPEAQLVHSFGPRPRQAGKADDSLSVLDVAVDAPRVAVLVREGYGDTATFQKQEGCVGFCTPVAGTAGGGLLDRLYLSDDLGASWRAVALEALPDLMTYQGLHLSAGRAVLVTRTPSEFRYFEFDVTTGARVANEAWEALATRRPPSARGGRLAAWGSFSFGFDSYFESLLLDLPAGTTLAGGFANTLSQLGADYPVPLVGPSASHDGVAWWSTKVSASFRPQDFCLMTVTLAADQRPMPSVAGCVPLASLPTSFTGATPVVSVDGRVALVASDRVPGAEAERHWWWPVSGAVDPARAGVLPEGVRPILDDKAVHPALQGGIVLARDLGEGRTQHLAWTGGGFDALEFPPLCTPPGCSEGLVAAVPLEGDTWLLFHSADVSSTRAQQELRLFARRVSVPRVAVELATKRPGLDDVVPGAAPAGPLERACTHLAACGTAPSFRDCLQTWALAAPCDSVEALTGASSAAGLADCTALRAATPMTCPAPAACQANADTCTGAGTALRCAGRVGLSPTVEACGALGLTCSGGTCAPTTPASDCGSGPFNWQRCVGGRYLTWCATPSARHALDCGALGFAGCVDVVERPGMPNVPARCE